MSTPTPPAVAVDLGHAPVWDPPAEAPSVNRWTCRCGAAVLAGQLDPLGGFAAYGSATEHPCPLYVEEEST
jgi:hypothetical protein